MTQENKQTFFRLSLRPSYLRSFDLNYILRKLDLVFEDMSATEEIYVYMSIKDVDIDNINLEAFNKNIMAYPLSEQFEILSYFKTSIRKRPGQLAKSLDFNFKDMKDKSIDHSGITKEKFMQDILRAKSLNYLKCLRLPSIMHSYDANDLIIFDDYKNLYPWQKQVYNIIFNENKEFNVPHNRKIISIVDSVGNTGKSNFIKWLCYNNADQFIKLSYGTASQLRSAIVSAGPRIGYIIDLPRTQGTNDKIADILSVIEDLKNGYVTTAMYGRNASLMIKPPFVFVLSNRFLPYSALSEDRWETFEIIFGTKKLRPMSGKELLKAEQREKIRKIEESVKKKLLEDSIRKNITNEFNQKQKLSQLQQKT